MIPAADLLRRFETFPFATLGEILGHHTPLILAPHPDDETLGCGGLIAACCAAHRPPLVLIITDGAGSHPNSPTYPPSRLRALREQETHAATALLGLPPGRLHFLRLPDTAAPHDGPEFGRAVAAIATLAHHHGANTLLAPWLHDPHCDHEAAQKMARATGLPLLSYPVWGWTLPADAPLPDTPTHGWRLDITPHLAAKRRAIAAHASQCTGLIADDLTGFRLPPGLLATLTLPYEVFLRTPS